MQAWAGSDLGRLWPEAVFFGVEKGRLLCLSPAALMMSSWQSHTLLYMRPQHHVQMAFLDGRSQHGTDLPQSPRRRTRANLGL